MVSKLRLCRATQSARASASATVVIASTSTASYSPKIKVEVIGSKPSASPKGLGRSPTIVFPGAVKTFTPSVFDATGAVTRVASFSPVLPSIGTPFRCQRVTVQGEIGRSATTNLLDERIDRYQSIAPTGLLGTCGVPAEVSKTLPSELSSRKDGMRCPIRKRGDKQVPTALSQRRWCADDGDRMKVRVRAFLAPAENHNRKQEM